MTDEPHLNRKVLEMMLEAPETQLDRTLAEKLREVLVPGKTPTEIRDGLREVLDRSARYSLASDFVMRVLDQMWRDMGGKKGDPTPWRAEIEREERDGR